MVSELHQSVCVYDTDDYPPRSRSSSVVPVLASCQGDSVDVVHLRRLLYIRRSL